MKIVGRGKVLLEGDVRLRLEPEMAAALGLGRGSTLYAVVVTPEGKKPPHSPPPSKRAGARVKEYEGLKQWVTVVASPFPVPSWANLVRASITIDPAPGSLRGLLAILNQAGIYCRYMESTNGLDLRWSGVYGQEKASSSQESPDLIIPSTLMVLEVPVGASHHETDGRAGAIRNKLRSLIQEGRSVAESARSDLQDLLLSETNLNVSVDWISPMATLNRLGLSISHSNSSELREKLLVEQEKDNGWLFVSAQEWRKLFWPIQEKVPDSSSRGPELRIFCLGHVDANEKIAVWDLFSSGNHFLARFEMLVPANALEHHWWEWIMEVIREAGGNILVATSSARLDGYWSTIRLFVGFPVDEKRVDGKPGDIASVLKCFKVLQGREGGTSEFGKFAKGLESHKKIVDELLMRQHRTNLGGDGSSTLQNVRIWDPRFSTPANKAYVNRFAKNPFSFTKPLDLETYNLLYSANVEGRRGRVRLAERIVQRLSEDPGENIAIVGAPRAGKTTVLNLVHDLLSPTKFKAREGPLAINSQIIPIRINAATTSPLMVFVEVVNQIKAWATGWDGTATSQKVKEAADAAWKEFTDFRRIGIGYGGFGVQFAPGRLREREAMLRDLDNPKSASDVLNWSLGTISVAQGSDILRRSLEFMRNAVPEGVRLAVLVDEVSTLSEWGRAEYFPIWRHVIESRDFERIRWLISTSRPLDAATHYSPITNVFKEYNVGSLRPEECEGFLKAFSPPGDIKDYLYPVLTFNAGRFIAEITSRLPYLMQVTCYHLYDQATRSYSPIVHKKMCQDLVFKEILSEVSDYLEHQWRQIPQRAQETILASIYRLPSETKEFFESYREVLKVVTLLPPDCLKSLRRSGLQGDDDFVVAPLVAFWLRNTTNMSSS